MRTQEELSPIVAKTEHGVLREEFQWMHGGKPDRHSGPNGNRYDS